MNKNRHSVQVKQIVYYYRHDQYPSKYIAYQWHHTLLSRRHK